MQLPFRSTPQNVQRLLAVQSRRIFLSAYMIAANLIVYSCTIILVLASIVVAPLARPSLLAVVASIPSMLLLIAVASAVMLLLTPLVSSTIQRIVVLLLITIPLAWDNIATYLFANVSFAQATLLQDALNTVFGVILWPSLHLFATVVSPDFSQTTLVVYAVHIAILAALVWLAHIWYARKHITNI
jgi:hypothetical protein